MSNPDVLMKLLTAGIQIHADFLVRHLHCTIAFMQVNYRLLLLGLDHGGHKYLYIFKHDLKHHLMPHCTY